MMHGIGGMGMKGIVDDFAKVIRPKGPEGEILPAATIEVDVSDKTLTTLGLISLFSIVIAKALSPKSKK